MSHPASYRPESFINRFNVSSSFSLSHQCLTAKENMPTRLRAICYYLRVLFGSHHWCSSFVSHRDCSGIPFAKQSRSPRQNSSRSTDSPIRIPYRATMRPRAPKQLRLDYGKTVQFFRPIRPEKPASSRWAMGSLQFRPKVDFSFRQPITRIREQTAGITALIPLSGYRSSYCQFCLSYG